MNRSKISLLLVYRNFILIDSGSNATAASPLQ